MRRYTGADEERIRLQAHVRDWTSAGLIDAAQAQQIDTRLKTDLNRTGLVLRGAVAAFTAIAVAAAVGLVFVTFRIRGDATVAAAFAFAALAAFGAADMLVATWRLYRYGVEEVLAASAVVFLAISVVAATHVGGSPPGYTDRIVGLAVGAAGAFVVYRRFGFVYAGVASTIAAGLIPFQFSLDANVEHGCAAAVFGMVFFVARARHRAVGDDFPGSDYAVVAAAACGCAYLSLNLHAIDPLRSIFWRPTVVPRDSWFYWFTYAATMLVPAAALVDAIRARDRTLLAAGIGMALVTLATNKPYLGQPRQTWDPMTLGVLLVGGTIVVRRWIAAGPGGQRGGYTPARLGADRRFFEGAANASVAWHGRAQPPPATTPDSGPSPFQGGRSGGGGAGAGY